MPRAEIGTRWRCSAHQPQLRSSTFPFGNRKNSPAHAESILDLPIVDSFSGPICKIVHLSLYAASISPNSSSLHIFRQATRRLLPAAGTIRYGNAEEIRLETFQIPPLLG